jgi:hypothetical protein
MPELPNLGLATTRELLAEVSARMAGYREPSHGPGHQLRVACVNAELMLPDHVLDYRTVDGY